MTGSSALLDVQRSGEVVLAQLARPTKANALSRALLAELDDFTRALADPEHELHTSTVVILAGQGGKAFSAGADINELEGLTYRSATAQMLWGQEVFTALEDAPQATIAAIDGVAYGGGLELAMACDIRLASPAARFGQPEVTLGNLPGWGGTQRLPRLVGEGRALEMILTGEPISAERAEQIGLVNHLHDDPLAAAQQLAGRICRHSAVAIRECKRAVYTGLRDGVATGLMHEARSVGTCCESEEQRRAVQRFLAKKRS